MKNHHRILPCGYSLTDSSPPTGGHNLFHLYQISFSKMCNSQYYQKKCGRLSITTTMSVVEESTLSASSRVVSTNGGGHTAESAAQGLYSLDSPAQNNMGSGQINTHHHSSDECPLAPKRHGGDDGGQQHKEDGRRHQIIVYPVPSCEAAPKTLALPDLSFLPQGHTQSRSRLKPRKRQRLELSLFNKKELTMN